MGGGDPKLFAAIGAWPGAPMPPFVVVEAGAIGLILLTVDRLRGPRVDRQTPIAFGALLALAAGPLWIVNA